MHNYSLKSLNVRFDKSYHILKEYCEMVEKYYKEDLGLKHFKQNIHDIIFNNLANPVIILDKNKVIAGTILYKKRVDEQILLPLEHDTSINLSKVIKKNGLVCNDSLCEISRIIVRREYRDRRITNEILGLTIAKAVKEGCEYLFSTTLESYARNFRILSTRIGLDYTILDEPIPSCPIYEGLDMKLTCANFKTFELQKLLSSCHFSDLISKMYNISNVSKTYISLSNQPRAIIGIMND